MQDVVTIARDLVQFASVTPEASKALDYGEQFLSDLGFSCRRLVRGKKSDAVDNLYAAWGNADQRLLFCGHLDVVPPGDPASWAHDPFAGVIENGVLHGRGSVDMKGNVAGYFSALQQVLPTIDGARYGLAVLLTGDEEGPAEYGVRCVVPELVGDGEKWSGCLTGEPTSLKQVGDAYKCGRRGSLSGMLTIHGVQGHTAYPSQADNAVHRMIDALHALRCMPLDQGNADFEPSWLEVASVDVGNPASNVIPARATARMNYRFNTEQTSDGLKQKTRDVIAQDVPQKQFTLEWRTPSEPYMSPHGWLSETLTQAIAQVCGIQAQATTMGGTSDSRFLYQHCPVVDFGLCGQGMHGVNEAVPLEDLRQLSKIYQAFLRLALC